MPFHRHRPIMTPIGRKPFMVILAIWALLLATACREPKTAAPLKLFDLQTQQFIAGVRAMDALKRNRLVLVGEHHTNQGHHRAQLRVIQTLNEQSVPLSIGLEMFRKDSQAALDQWVAGELDETAFVKIYLDNWNFPWSLYRSIFVYARDMKIPLAGLNVSRETTRQVAEQGFASLSDRQRGELEGVTCNVTREYRDFIRSAFDAHGHGNMDFVHFCEAQLVWDTAMAINSLDYLERHPDRVMVLLAGSGHVRKMGVPFQIKSRFPIPTTVLLPHTPGIFEPATLTSADADFITTP
jgi:uncharacterized iron-regulated protein